MSGPRSDAAYFGTRVTPTDPSSPAEYTVRVSGPKATRSTTRPWSGADATSCQVAASNTRTWPACVPTATYFPSADAATHRIAPGVRTDRFSTRLSTSHTFTGASPG